MVSPGDRYGPYSCVRKIGEGGMAETYLAHQVGPRGFEKRVCIKIIRPDCRCQPKFAEMFMAEAIIAASLRHSNIVSVIDVSQEGGYMVLELVDGVDLRTLVQATPGRRLVADLVTYVALELVKALDFAHNRRLRGKPQGLVHRDIKPSNILVSYSGEVKIADFGIAKAIRSMGDSDGLIRGTPLYMSPEQAQGLRLDARSDLFSLGIMLYELLAGRRPFDGHDDPDTCRRICSGDYVRLAEAAPDVPAGLAAVVEKLLSVNPEERYASAEALGRSLDKFSPPASVYRRLGVLAREARPPETLMPLDATGGPVVSQPVDDSADDLAQDAAAPLVAEHGYRSADPGASDEPAAAGPAGAEPGAAAQHTLPIADTEPMFADAAGPAPDASGEADAVSALALSGESMEPALPGPEKRLATSPSRADPETGDGRPSAFLRSWPGSARQFYVVAAGLMGVAAVAGAMALALRAASGSPQAEELKSPEHREGNRAVPTGNKTTAPIEAPAQAEVAGAVGALSKRVAGSSRSGASAAWTDDGQRDTAGPGLAWMHDAPAVAQPSSTTRPGPWRTGRIPLRGAPAKGAARVRVGVFPWGNVWINGHACGRSPVYAELPVGRHVIGGGVDQPTKSKVVRLKSGENRQIVISLKAETDDS